VVPFAVLSRTNSPRHAANSFRIRSYANRPILHYFGANKSFRIRSYRHPARNPFRIRSYEKPGGWGCPPGNSADHLGSVSPCRRLPRRGRGGKGASDLHNFGAPITTFRINTCISVASKRLYLPLESTLMKKQGEGGGSPLERSKRSRDRPNDLRTQGVLGCLGVGHRLHRGSGQLEKFGCSRALCRLRYKP